MTHKISRFLTIVSLFFFQYISSQETLIPELKTQKGFGKLDFISFDLPDGEPDMRLAGIHYNLFLNDWAYTGLGIYGAVSGERGGFFTLGIDAGIKKFISKNWYIDAGMHYGGGGGARTQDGGGAFILPHFNLGYQFEKFSFNAGWNYINFFDGGFIKHHQMNVAVEVPLNFTYSNYADAETEYEYSNLKTSDWNVSSHKNGLFLHLNNLKIGGTDLNPNVVKLGRKTIRLAGFEFSHYLNNNWFGFVKVNGAYAGIRAGYMDVFLGGGYQYAFNKNRTNIVGKFAIGAGGGGEVESKGGFLINPDISIEQRVFDDTFIAINKGIVMTPNSQFNTSSIGVGIKHYINRGGIIDTKETFTSGKFKGLEIITKHDIYLDAKRMTRPTQDLHQISLQINLNLTKNLYAAGQTSFAVYGNAGAYGEGVVGLGVKTNPFFNNKASLYLQSLFGGAGGGNISTGEGLISKSSIGINHQITNSLSLRAESGYVKAKGGNLSSAMINFGVNYHISFLKMK